MYRHHGHAHRPYSQASATKKSESLEVKNIFAGIVEIEQAADLLMPRESPVIALCDSEGLTNWVSQKFVDDLSKSNLAAPRPLGRARRRKSGDISHIYIRWTCRKLELYSQSGIFYIEPKANFKILFGCGYNIRADLRNRIEDHPSPYDRMREKKHRQEELILSHTIVDSFRRGIQEGILLQLRRMPVFPDDRVSYMTVAELETELSYVHGSYSTIDDALNSTSNEKVNPSYPIPSIHTIEVESSQDSFMSESEAPSCTASTNTSMSEEVCRGRPLSERLRRERCQPRQHWGVEEWFDQGIYEKPWITRMVQQRPHQGSFTLYPDLARGREQYS